MILIVSVSVLSADELIQIALHLIVVPLAEDLAVVLVESILLLSLAWLLMFIGPLLAELTYLVLVIVTGVPTCVIVLEISSVISPLLFMIFKIVIRLLEVRDQVAPIRRGSLCAVWFLFTLYFLGLGANRRGQNLKEPLDERLSLFVEEHFEIGHHFRAR